MLLQRKGYYSIMHRLFRGWNRPRFGRSVMLTSALLTMVALLAGCGERLVADKIESRVERRLPDIIGPADSYEVSVSGRTPKMLSGRLSELVIHGRNVQLQPDLNVDDLVVEMRDVEFDTGKNELTGVGETAFSAVISGKCLTRFIVKRQPDLKELKIELRPGKATVRVRPSLLGLSAGVAITGGLEVAPSNKISFIPDKMSVAGLPIPERALNFVSERINPVMDMSLASFPAQITRIAVMAGRIRVEGTADLRRGLSAEKGS